MSEKALRKYATKEVKIIEWIINYMAESTGNIVAQQFNWFLIGFNASRIIIGHLAT